MPLNDGNTWDSIWKILAPRLLVYLEAFGTLNEADREDIVQRVFLKAWRGRAFLRVGADPADSLKPWFYRAARNEALDLAKRRNRERLRFPPRAETTGDDPEPPAPDRGDRPESAALDAEAGDFVRRFLASCDDAEREIAHLAFCEDLSYARIATATGRPLGTVKWRAAALKRKLEAAYGKEFGI